MLGKRNGGNKDMNEIIELLKRGANSNESTVRDIDEKIKGYERDIKDLEEQKEIYVNKLTQYQKALQLIEIEES